MGVKLGSKEFSVDAIVLITEIELQICLIQDFAVVDYFSCFYFVSLVLGD